MNIPDYACLWIYECRWPCYVYLDIQQEKLQIFQGGLRSELFCAYASWLEWLFLALPLEIRCAAQSLSAAVNMICSFLMAHPFLSLLCGMRFTLFFVLASFVFLMTCFFAASLPETNSIPPGEMSQIWRPHCYWTWLMEQDDIDHVFANDKDNWWGDTVLL